eukprot:c19279_g1_i1 orf=263-1489(-)
MAPEPKCLFPSLSLLLLLPLLLLALTPQCMCIGCTNSHTTNGVNKTFANCNDLQVQEASIAWSLDAQNGTLEVLFSGTAPAAGGWVGWGINPSGLSMDGTQAFIAFQAPNGSTILTYNVTTNTEAGAPLACTPISLRVLDMGVEISGMRINIFVSLLLPSNQSNATTLLNHVWNRGPAVSGFQPAPHSFSPKDLSGLKTINMSSGIISFEAPQPPHYLLKNRHAMLNTVGWGILLPGGVIAARYLRPLADPAWFYVHVIMQMAGYALGVAGWATGLSLGNYSIGVVYKKHRFIGIALFAISTLQVMAILLRPKKEHKIRKGWNFYHYTLGATILALGIINIFFGFDILSPQPKWRHAYIGVLGALAALIVVFEITNWIHTLSKKHSTKGKMQGVNIGGAYVFEKGPEG